MKKTKKFLSLVLVVLMFVSVIPIGASAESQRDAIVRIALAEEGTSGCPNKYTYAYGQIGGTYNWGWCAAFIYWCAQQAGIPHSIIGRTASASVNSFNTPYYSYSSSSNVQKGDILYLTNNYGNHVGLVYAVDATYIYTIEGNMGNAVKKYKYRRSDGYITWSSSSEWQRITHYGVPNYEGSTPTPSEPTSILYPTSGATYKIASGVGNNMYLDFDYNSDNVQIYEDTNNSSSVDLVKDQYFKLTHISDGWYTITNARNGKVFDVWGADPASGANIVQHDYNKGDNQLFRFYDAGNGYCYIKSKLGTYVDVANGDNVNNTNVWAYEFNGTTAQKWKLEKESILNCDDASSMNNTHHFNTETLRLHGWAFSDRKLNVSFKYILDSNSPVSVPNVLREDVKKAYPTVCNFNNPGYSFNLNLSDISTGKHTIKVVATSVSGASTTVSNICFYIDQHNHSYTSTITTNPTCKTDGIRTYKCSCGDSYTQNIGKHPATHVGGTEIRNARASTCKDTGYTGDTYCKGCGGCLGFGTSIDKNYNNHAGDTEVKNAKTATCSAEGYTGDTYCKGCNTKLSSGKAIAKNPHNSNITIPAVAATCTKTGLTEGKKCSVCGTVTVAQQTVAKKAHTYTSSVTTQPTCTKDGVRTYKCSCGASYVENIAKYGHNSNTTIPAVAATCTKTGLTTGKKCSVCGTVTVAQQTIAQKAHTEVVDKAVSATCTNTGLTEGKHCSTCSTVIVAQQTVSAINHIDNDGDYMCDYDCGFDFANSAPETPDEPDAPSNDCSCMCHKSGIMGFIWKIILFFNKLFKTNKTCACGLAHY